MDENTFWQIVDDSRVAGGGDPEAMADVIGERLQEADDDTLRSIQQHLVAASARLYTWRHAEAAELIWGYMSDDVFTDWRSWVVSLGRRTFEAVAADPDALADVRDIDGAGEGVGELFGSAVSEIWFDRHGYDDETFPILEPSEPPTGERSADHAAVRRALPRLAARIPDDGLGQGPREFPTTT